MPDMRILNTRNYGRQSDQHGPSVVLKPQGRIAKHGKRRIVVSVDLGYPDINRYGTYRHPMVHFRTVDDNGETSLCGLRVDMKFQSHAVDSTDHPDTGRSRSRGFLRPNHGLWVSCYGSGELRGDFRYHGDGKEITKIIALVNRARKCRPRTDCELLALLVGLRRCGVEVRVWSSWIDAQRSYRRPAEPLALAA